MVDRLKDKVAIVTGAGSIGPGVGNGKATALVFAREGARVMLIDNNLQAAEETRCLIDKEGGNCFAFKADVTKSSECENIARECVRTYDKIDILHNNVGVSSVAGLYSTSEEDWDRVMDINLKSMFLMCKHIIPYMEKQQNGVIINISTIQAIKSAPFSTLAYSVSKSGVIALTKEIANEFAAKGIRANAVLPGIIRTPFVEVALTKRFNGDTEKIEQVMKERTAILPMKKQGESWDVAYAALFLASDEAKYITGTTLLVDGFVTGRMNLV